jgi:YidC/Oxa1 family membrane protein insertase
MGSLFTTIIYQPLLNLTVFIYNTIGVEDLGLTIILMTLVVRLAMLPLSLKTARSQKAMAELAPEIDRIKADHKGNMTAQSEAVTKLYKERGVSPLAGCLPLIIQFPLLIGLYRVFLNIFKPETLNLLYTSIPHPETISHLMFGLLDISVKNPILAILAGAVQFTQAKLSLQSQPASSQAAAMNKQMMYLFPILIIVIGWNLPAGLPLYWISTTLFSIGEQLYLRRS